MGGRQFSGGSSREEPDKGGKMMGSLASTRNALPTSARPRRRRELAGDSKGGSADDLLPLTLPEARRLLARLAWKRLVRKEESLHWSRWRRRHQMRAKRCHYRSRGATFHG